MLLPIQMNETWFCVCPKGFFVFLVFGLCQSLDESNSLLKSLQVETAQKLWIFCEKVQDHNCLSCLILHGPWVLLTKGQDHLHFQHLILLEPWVLHFQHWMLHPDLVLDALFDEKGQVHPHFHQWLHPKPQVLHFQHQSLHLDLQAFCDTFTTIHGHIPKLDMRHTSLITLIANSRHGGLRSVVELTLKVGGSKSWRVHLSGEQCFPVGLKE